MARKGKVKADSRSASYLTIIGHNIFESINPFWAASEKGFICPEVCYLLQTPELSSQFNEVKRWFLEIGSTYLALPQPLAIEGKNDIPQQIDTPYPCLWEFLYILSVLYGRIKVKMGGEPLFGLQGVWSQKDVREWEEEMLQVWFPKGAGLGSSDYEDLKKIQAKLAKSLKVLRVVKKGETGVV